MTSECVNTFLATPSSALLDTLCIGGGVQCWKSVAQVFAKELISYLSLECICDVAILLFWINELTPWPLEDVAI